jgi:hypothetical protein
MTWKAAIAMLASLLAAPAIAQEALPAATPGADDVTDPTLTEALAPSDEAEDDALLDSSELAALGIASEAPAVDTSLKISGFGDFTVGVPVLTPPGTASGVNAGSGKYTSFYIGNINLYFTKNLTESFRTMLEVRFTYLPNGAVDTSSLDAQNLTLRYTSTDVSDYRDSGHIDRWGGIILQRFYLDWSLHANLTVRMGQFLTPYGIWNVDHGSPTYIPVYRPYAIGNNWFPQRQSGFELFGRADVTSQLSIGYHATLSNGTGPISEYRDLDRNKAVGARLYLEHRGAGYLRIGASGYYGRETSSVPNITVTNGEVGGGEKVTSQFDALALAADIQYRLRGLLAQAEVVSQQRKYARDARPPATSLSGQGYAVDALSWAAYGLLGYQLPWWALMPYFMLEYNDETTTLGSAHNQLWLIHAGINLHPADSVTFKVEYLQTKAIESLLKKPFALMQFQAAWAF